MSLAFKEQFLTFIEIYFNFVELAVLSSGRGLWPAVAGFELTLVFLGFALKLAWFAELKLPYPSSLARFIWSKVS